MLDEDSIVAAEREYLGEYYGPVPEETVAAAEQELGIRLPVSYRVFLRNYGAGMVHDYSIHGLTCDEPNQSFFDNFLDITTTLWSGPGQTAIPRNLIFITCNGYDLFYYLDTSRMNEAGECPVIALGPDADHVVVADSFLEFLRKLRNEERLL